MKNYSNEEIINLVKLAKNGDKHSLEEILRFEEAYLKSHFSKKGIYRDDILDIIQSVLIKISKNLHNLSAPASFFSWAKRIANNVFYDYVKALNKHNNKILTIKDDHLLIPDNSTAPQFAILNSELGKIIKKTMQDLPRNYKLAIIMREFSGFSYEKIADISNVKIGTVKSRISRARNAIKSELKEYIRGNI